MNDDEMEAQMEYWKSKAEAAEAECKSLAAERRETVAEWEREGLRMSAENRRLREALEKIAECAESCVDVEDTTLREEWVSEVARAALGEKA